MTDEPVRDAPRWHQHIEERNADVTTWIVQETVITRVDPPVPAGRPSEGNIGGTTSRSTEIRNGYTTEEAAKALHDKIVVGVRDNRRFLS